MTGAGTKEVWNRVPEFSLSQHYSFKCLLRFTALCPGRGHFPGGGGGKQATEGRWQDWRNACVRWSLAHGGHRTNISSPAELLQQWLYGTRTIHYLLSPTLFSWVWTLYLQVIQLPASRSCLQIRMAFVKTRGHESHASSFPTVPNLWNNCRSGKEPPRRHNQETRKDGQVTVGSPRPLRVSRWAASTSSPQVPSRKMAGHLLLQTGVEITPRSL